jgi:alanine-glyoxylate transaminase/serine-glyoxylate transaminase/serine-pyruvate transaminase
VLNDIQAISKLVSKISPDSLISVDGVCSVAGETIRQEEWGIDVVMTASQKAIGVPPGITYDLLNNNRSRLDGTISKSHSSF